jgi:diguanylate cyclase (GGDEF)-like protein
MEPSQPLSAETLRRILDILDTGVRVVDLDGNIVYANDEADRLDRKGAGPLFDSTPSDIPPVDRRAHPLHDDQGQLIGHVEVLRDISKSLAIEQENAALRLATMTDPLTGLANRRHLDSELTCRHDQFQQPNISHCVLIADIDHFKHINDTAGHITGDEALLAVARTLADHCRPGDLVGRYGGDEFLILVPQITAKNAVTLAERLRAAVASSPIAGTRLTISLGVAEAGARESPAQLLARADAALRRAKSEGRDRVVLAENPEWDQPARAGD